MNSHWSTVVSLYIGDPAMLLDPGEIYPTLPFLSNTEEEATLNNNLDCNINSSCLHDSMI